MLVMQRPTIEAVGDEAGNRTRGTYRVGHGAARCGIDDVELGLWARRATVDRRDMQYLYRDGADFVWMDPETFDQLMVPEATVGDAANFLLEGATAQVAMHEGEPLYVELPTSVVLEVTYTEPGLQGDRSTGGTKPATLETGHQIQVPLFITTGEKIKVDTRDGRYLGRS